MQQPTRITVTQADLRWLDTIIIQLDDSPPEPGYTWLRLAKAELEQFIPQREVQQ